MLQNNCILFVITIFNALFKEIAPITTFTSTLLFEKQHNKQLLYYATTSKHKHKLTQTNNIIWLTLKLGHPQNCLPPFLIVLAVLNTATTPQLHVGASPKPLQPPLLQHELWFRITRELWEQEEDDWTFDISSPFQKNQKKRKLKLGQSPQQKGTLIWSQINTIQVILCEPLILSRICCTVPAQEVPNSVKEYLTEGTKINPFKKFGY